MAENNSESESESGEDEEVKKTDFEKGRRHSSQNIGLDKNLKVCSADMDKRTTRLFTDAFSRPQAV